MKTSSRSIGTEEELTLLLLKRGDYIFRSNSEFQYFIPALIRIKKIIPEGFRISKFSSTVSLYFDTSQTMWVDDFRDGSMYVKRIKYQPRSRLTMDGAMHTARYNTPSSMVKWIVNNCEELMDYEQDKRARAYPYERISMGQVWDDE